MKHNTRSKHAPSELVRIRPETPDDYGAIAEINRLAFQGDEEAKLIERVRHAPDFDPHLSLVALVGRRLVGHILFSPIDIDNGPRKSRAVALAPMAVRPEHQRKGIGTHLVNQGLRVCTQAGHRIVIVVGHAEYYPRFGFVPASRFGITCPFPAPDEAFLALDLAPGALLEASGMVVYPEAFSAT